MRRALLAVTSAMLMFSSVLLTPSVANAAPSPPTAQGLTVTSYNLTIDPQSPFNYMGCSSFHGYPECGLLALDATVTGWTQYGGLNGLLGTWPPLTGGMATGSADVAATVVCLNTGAAFTVNQNVPIRAFWSNYDGYLPLSVVDNDTAHFTGIIGGWHIGANDAMACDDGLGLFMNKTINVSNVHLFFDGFGAPYPAHIDWRLSGTWHYKAAH